MTLLRRPVSLVLLFFAVAEALFAFRVQVPHRLVFDEVHYVPAARALLALQGPRNIEHPLFAKTLIALSIRLFGDDSLGWRALSTLAGASVVAGSVAIAWLVWRRVRPAVTVGIAVLANFTVLIQARIAMLDGFMAAFVVAAIAVLLWSMRAGDAGRAWRRWLGGAMLLGLATGCKWTALPYLGFAGIGFLWVRWRDGRGLWSGNGQRHWPGLPAIPALASLGLVAAVVYLATFAPAFLYATDPLTPTTLLSFQATMFRQQTQVLPPHTYQSAWWTWPLMIRPVWYLYEQADGAQRGILMLGNPAELWSGLVAVPPCLWAGLRRGGDPRLTAVAGLWLASVLMWALIPKSLGFFYYSYLSTILVALPIAGAWDRFGRGRLAGWDEAWLTCVLALFVFFLPILAAFPLAGPRSFEHWMWLGSWR
ncbi:phospholipid carrier-dependent glycosyltransferase [Sphingomonas bacterium]|uniref:phospholipid carrier-dependent glycosyltransferase n=1 Tax=Sphingomonas bacterium TaxID=1895847 RepID=UPI0020C72ABD|nr:phospholipid carrier-dependent glycosyltransferase [Sphingomonas bacterium]